MKSKSSFFPRKVNIRSNPGFFRATNVSSSNLDLTSNYLGCSYFIIHLTAFVGQLALENGYHCTPNLVTVSLASCLGGEELKIQNSSNWVFMKKAGTDICN